MQVTGCLVQADTAFLSSFETCTLPESEWTHAAHIRLAWICLNLQSPELALERIRSGILRYNTEVLNRRHKYHETVTVAFTRMVARRMRKDEAWADFAMRIDDILDPEDPILLRYYSQERLFSDIARKEYVEPDLQEIPPLSDD
jgi:hypothetical protein